MVLRVTGVEAERSFKKLLQTSVGGLDCRGDWRRGEVDQSRENGLWEKWTGNEDRAAGKTRGDPDVSSVSK